MMYYSSIDSSILLKNILRDEDFNFKVIEYLQYPRKVHEKMFTSY